RYRPAISVAAVNGPHSLTLSGDEAVLSEVNKALNEAGLFSHALQVDLPFHSRVMEQLRAELLECLRDINPRPTTIPFFSTVTGSLLLGSELDAQYWYRNMRQPVLFQDAMTELVKLRHRLFLEIGAHPILRNDIAACVSEKGAQRTVLGSLQRGKCDRAELLRSLGQLYCLGAELDWQQLFPTEASTVKLPIYPFQRESFWRESDQ